jgi:hypothetical protein
MKIIINRKYKKETYTIGEMSIDGKYFCSTLEDKDRGLTQDMSSALIATKKVYGQTAIPAGTYEITLDVVSKRLSKYPFYIEVCGGKVPRFLNVPGFEGILFHVADGARGAELVDGCVGVGDNLIKGGLLNGKETFKKLYKKMEEAKNKGEKITVTIQ